MKDIEQRVARYIAEQIDLGIKAGLKAIGDDPEIFEKAIKSKDEQIEILQNSLQKSLQNCQQLIEDRDVLEKKIQEKYEEYGELREAAETLAKAGLECLEANPYGSNFDREVLNLYRAKYPSREVNDQTDQP